MDNKKDIKDWNDDAELKKLGIAYAEACAEWLKLEKKEASTAAPTNTPAPAAGMYRVFDASGKQVGAYTFEENAFNTVKQLLLADGAARITLSDK